MIINSGVMYGGVGESAALFLTIAPDAKSAALGETGVACGDDVSTMYWNPAGLVNIKELDVIFSHLDYLSDFSYNFLGAALSVNNIGSFGLGLVYLGTDPFSKYDSTGAKLDDVNLFKDMAISGSYARNLNEMISVGATVKLVSQTLADKSSTSLAFDAGALAKDIAMKNLSVGLVIKNIGSGPNFGGESDSLPFQISAGAGYKYSIAGIKFNSLIDVNLPNYYSFNFGIGQQAEIAIGQDFAFFPRIGIKMPYEHGIFSALTFGAGVKLADYTIDASYVNYDELNSAMRFSILMKF